MHDLKLIVSTTTLPKANKPLISLLKQRSPPRFPCISSLKTKKAHDLSTVKIVVGILIAIAVLAVVAYAYISYNADSEDSDEL